MSTEAPIFIHPTAIVEGGAILGPGVSVGAFAIVGAQVKLGARCQILAHAQVINSVELGDDCIVGRGAILGEDPQSIGFDPSTPSDLKVGSDNRFREHVTVHRGAKAGSSTVIGSGNYFMVGSHVGHDCLIGDRNIIANACLLGGHVTIGDRAFLGGGAGFHQFTRIGDLAMVQGNAIMNRDVPPYLIAGAQSQVFGLNVIGLRRGLVASGSRDEIRKLYRLLFRGSLNLKQAIAQVEGLEWGEEALKLLEFMKAPSHQGVCRARRKGGDEG